jgi:hypothetical protein
MSTPIHEILEPTYPVTESSSDSGTRTAGSPLREEQPSSPPPSRREENYRLEDDLELLRAERVVSRASNHTRDISRSRSKRHGSRTREPVDDFDITTNPVHDSGKGVWRPPERPTTKVAKFLKAVSTLS